MTLRRRDVIKLLAAVTGGAIPAKVVLAQGTSAPAGGRIVFENEKVRVIEHLARSRLGVCGTGLHSHPAHLSIYLTDVRARDTTPGREPRIVERKAGDVEWHGGGSHVLENIGSRDSRLYSVELKTDA